MSFLVRESIESVSMEVIKQDKITLEGNVLVIQYRSYNTTGLRLFLLFPCGELSQYWEIGVAAAERIRASMDEFLSLPNAEPQRHGVSMREELRKELDFIPAFRRYHVLHTKKVLSEKGKAIVLEFRRYDRTIRLVIQGYGVSVEAARMIKTAMEDFIRVKSSTAVP